jgi:hypothetical protein
VKRDEDEEPREEAEAEDPGLSFFCFLKFVWEESTELCTGRF